MISDTSCSLRAADMESPLPRWPTLLGAKGTKSGPPTAAGTRLHPRNRPEPSTCPEGEAGHVGRGRQRDRPARLARQGWGGREPHRRPAAAACASPGTLTPGQRPGSDPCPPLVLGSIPRAPRLPALGWGEAPPRPGVAGNSAEVTKALVVITNPQKRGHPGPHGRGHPGEGHPDPGFSSATAHQDLEGERVRRAWLQG